MDTDEITQEIKDRVGTAEIGTGYAYYAFRVRQLEEEGMDTSDAQGTADAEQEVSPTLWIARERIFNLMITEEADLSKALTILNDMVMEEGR